MDSCLAQGSGIIIMTAWGRARPFITKNSSALSNMAESLPDSSITGSRSSKYSPKTGEASADSRARADEFARFEANLMSFANARARERGQPPPFTVNVQVDGETIARATHNANQDTAARSFSPVPAY